MGNNSEVNSVELNIHNVFETVVSDYYDCVFEIDAESGRIKFYQIGELLKAKGVSEEEFCQYADICDLFENKFIVEEERSNFRSELKLDVIQEEIARNGNYVRTVHCDNVDGINSKSIRINRIADDANRLLFCLTDISMILDHDWMTDEYSRTGFIAKVEKLMEESEFKEGYSIVYTNIQGFKAINDIMGTFSGDMVIFMEREILKKELQPVVMSRFESDHFVLLTKTELLTDELLERVSHQSYVDDSKNLPILYRFGIYNIVDTEVKVQHMVDRAKLAEKTIPADHAVSYAFCDKKLTTTYVEQRRFVSELDKALAAGEFKPYFQPVVDAVTGEIVSAEVLIRWIHSTEGMISPGRFIPVFEKEGVISKIDSFMVDKVLDINLARIKAGKRVVPCAVNLSRVDFYDTKLLEIIRHKLERHTNIREILKLEVTESAYAVLENNALSFMEELKRLGVSLMLDDFGSGMSSFSTLESFEFDVIKLDMGFVSQIGKVAKTEAIIKHIIGLSHDLGARVVAEGVETKEQLEFLRTVDCDMIQGYYFYKPMPEEEFDALLSEG